MKNKTILNYKHQTNGTYNVELMYDEREEIYLGVMTEEQLIAQLKLQGKELRK